jgi:Xaa-Pro aminopeptidase
MDVFGERRRRVLAAIDGVAIVPSAPVTIRNNDVEHEYRQDSDFFYLTGFDEPESLLIITSAHPQHRAVLFVRPRDPEREVWDGARAGVDGARDQCGVDAAYPIAELRKRLPEYLTGARNLYYELGRSRALDDRLLAAVAQVRGKGRSPKPWPFTVRHPEPLWHEMRLVKDAHEIDTMRRAAAITAEAHQAAMDLATDGRREFEIDAAMRQVFRRGGAERPAYTPIVGSGPNATVLHYRAGERAMSAGELLLIDAGCEYRYYASDVTRTYPVAGRFSDAQRAIYEVVLAAQLAAIAEARPGSTIDAIHETTVRHLVEGMLRIGLLSGDADAIIKDESYKRYYMHRTSHWLGLDVHDVGAYYVDGKSRPLVPGMVLTIEPGIYVAESDPPSGGNGAGDKPGVAAQGPPPDRFRGIGVRIEDDILITADGHEVLTSAIPKLPDDVERACARA